MLFLQIVCAFLVRDKGTDWRMGAEWFETCLLDYDPCSNHGNWTYGAGDSLIVMDLPIIIYASWIFVYVIIFPCRVHDKPACTFDVFYMLVQCSCFMNSDSSLHSMIFIFIFTLSVPILVCVKFLTLFFSPRDALSFSFETKKKKKKKKKLLHHNTICYYIG
jgi:hypothetical protein